ncbi:MAG: ABC transporter ATP-binding protein [Anaerolineae bacterium]|jgi:simple sugar transport system ATP-binding protein|nr:ABC transporter ATP-binding protein [Anaerolineae bacterium]
MAENIPVLEVKNITKQFPGVLANDNVSVTLNKGEIHTILGENGAGKSTLLNIIYGLYRPDEGEILVNGKPIELSNTHDAIQHGIGMVHQHFMLVPVFSVTENIILGSEVTKAGMLNIREARRRVKALSKEHGLEVDPDALIEDLPVGVQQRVEILKALYRDAKILFLDEPTAVLTPQEVQDLFKVVESLRERGVSIIFISHKLKEVLQISDRITVMRRGRVVGSTTPQESDERILAEMMVGRDVILTVDKGPANPKETILRVMNMTVLGDQKERAVKGINFELRAGEILGIAGVQGNGQREFVEALTGLRPAQSGMIVLNGKPMHFNRPRQLVESAVSHVPEDRQKHGLVLPYSLIDNMVLCTYYQEPFAKGLIRQDEAMLENAEKLIKQFDVRTPSADTPAANLSGGNQQKVIVARELSRPVKLLVVNQPTRGLDVGSIEYIHSQIVKIRDEGAAVLLVSAELDEILSLSDRIAVMYHGEVVATMPREEATREGLGLLMAGITS